MVKSLSKVDYLFISLIICGFNRLIKLFKKLNLAVLGSFPMIFVPRINLDIEPILVFRWILIFMDIAQRIGSV